MCAVDTTRPLYSSKPPSNTVHLAAHKIGEPLHGWCLDVDCPASAIVRRCDTSFPTAFLVPRANAAGW